MNSSQRDSAVEGGLEYDAKDHPAFCDFDKEAREAAEFYVSLFPGSKIINVTRLTDTPSGDCDLVSFDLAGQPFMAISAGPSFKFNPSVSFHIKRGTTRK